MALPGDVIELGSSDEEVEPAPKKKKPPPNAMVHIPNNLPGVTIKPTNNKNKTNSTKISNTTIPVSNRTIISPTISKSQLNPLNIAKASIGKGITVTKVPSNKPPMIRVANPFAINKPNGGPKIVSVKSQQTKQPPIVNAITMPVTCHATRIPKQSLKTLTIAKGVITKPIQPFRPLPPGITVKRTSQAPQSAQKRKVVPIVVNRQAKRKNPATNSNEVVDLDDDDAAPSATSGPQWYLRPEEQAKEPTKKMNKSPVKLPVNKKSPEKAVPMEVEVEIDKNTTEDETALSLEKQNNKEPETPKFIEITIEDSPAKAQSKRACEIAEMAITIDDSPVKNTAEKDDHHSGSDQEAVPPEKQSKKKLDYPKSAKSVEIEIEFTPVDHVDPFNDDKNDSQDAVGTEIVEIEESPVKPPEKIHTSTPKKRPKPQIRVTEIKSIEQPKVPGEFHPIYQSFIDLCFQLENSEDMSKIVDKKIKAYYRQVPKEYTESEIFVDMVGSKINAMKAGPEKMYLYIKDVVDELNLQRKVAKSQPVKLDIVNEDQEKILYGEESEFDAKRQRQIRKLEKTLKKLHRAIQKLEEQEVDFDDEEDSVYLLTERYKERMIRVHAKFCQLTNTKLPSEPRVHIDARPGKAKGPAKRLERWINKKVPIGTPLPFPDFHDVLTCVRDANQEDKLGWNEVDIMEEARDLFTRCGKKLQRRRQENEWRLAASRIQQEIDPAEESEELKKKLEDNRRVASRKESEVLNKYADRQNQLNLEAVEIGDKEADESPVETDDEEPTDEKSSLETKEKRKERLKRLLQKKSKKANDGRVTDDNNSQPEIESIKLDETNVIGREKVSGDREINDAVDGEPENKEKEIFTDKLENPSDNNVKDPLADENDPLSDKKEQDDKGPSSSNRKDSKALSNSEKVHSLSDDSNKIDSDIDELHLLQKLHSDEINSSTLESSDSESPIAISDSLSSDNKKQASDVISIENSSYSESEKNEDEREYESCSRSKIPIEAVSIQMNVKSSNAGIEKKLNKSNEIINKSNEKINKSNEIINESNEKINKSNEKINESNERINKSNNQEYNESIEDILLASSEEEENKEKPEECTKPVMNSTETNAENQSSKDNMKLVTEETRDNNTATTDPISMDGVEMAVVRNVDSNATNIDNGTEATSVRSTESGDSEKHTKVDDFITSVESSAIQSDDNTVTNAIEDVETVKSIESVEDLKAIEVTQADKNIDSSSELSRNEPTLSVEDAVMKVVEESVDTTCEETNKSANIVDNDVTMDTNEAVEIGSEINSTESVDPKVNDESSVRCEIKAPEMEKDQIDSSKDNGEESSKTDHIVTVNNGDVVAKDDKPVCELMEIDVPIDTT